MAARDSGRCFASASLEGYQRRGQSAGFIQFHCARARSTRSGKLANNWSFCSSRSTSAWPGMSKPKPRTNSRKCFRLCPPAERIGAREKPGALESAALSMSEPAKLVGRSFTYRRNSRVSRPVPMPWRAWKSLRIFFSRLFRIFEQSKRTSGKKWMLALSSKN